MTTTKQAIILRDKQGHALYFSGFGILAVEDNDSRVDKFNTSKEARDYAKQFIKEEDFFVDSIDLAN